jgi:hypothetical protein
VGDEGRENEIANFLCRRLGETGNVICTHYYAAVVTHANRVSWVNLSIPFGAPVRGAHTHQCADKKWHDVFCIAKFTALLATTRVSFECDYSEKELESITSYLLSC